MSISRAQGFSVIRVWSLALVAILCCAQPRIARNGVANAASLIPATPQDGWLARGARVKIRGAGFASDARVTVGGLPVEILARTANEIEMRIPAAAPIGPSEIVVHSNRAQTAPARVRIVASAIGIYSANSEGWGPAREEASGNGLTLHATGIGPAAPIEVWVGGKRGRVTNTTAGRITVELAPGTPHGCFVPVIARQGPAWSNTVTTRVTRGGTRCENHASYPFASWTGVPAALVLLTRSAITTLSGQSRIEDEASAAFLQPGPAGTELGRPLLAPPAGACTSYITGNGPEISLAGSFSAMLMGALPGNPWDIAPKLSLIQGNYLHAVPRVPGAPGRFRSSMSGTRGMTGGPLSLDKGDFLITGPDGQGPFRMQLPAPAPFQCVNCASLTEIDRTRGVAVQWSGAAGGGMMAIVLASSDSEAFLQGSALCMAKAEGGQFTVPASALAHMPASTAATGLLTLIPLLDQPHAVPIAGAAKSMAASLYIQTQEIRFR
ncbi:MAG: IPT/TIG domain-containing protein [Acidobacteria bacterium]|nr:IPT/TIG domain-containing protein [Acidobacteriota bacterium]